jgi:hypothetical protein
MRVSEVVQTGDEVLLGDRLAATQLHRTGVDARERAVALAVQSRIHDPRE